MEIIQILKIEEKNFGSRKKSNFYKNGINESMSIDNCIILFGVSKQVLIYMFKNSEKIIIYRQLYLEVDV